MSKEKEEQIEKACITYERKIQNEYYKGTYELIHIKDDTSEKAFETFKKVKEFVEKK